MNFPMPKKFLPAVLQLFFFCATLAHAADEQRWLLVFDTSAAMKKRLPAVEAEIKSLLLSSVDGKLRAGDSLGVWTFDEKLRLGQFPLTFWQPERAGATVTNLTAFLRQQPLAGDTKFAALQPMLNRIIADSERLTVLIFCDGTDEIHWSPYDDGINGTLAQTAAERKKSQQPLVILLRTQTGKYVGATVNFPPAPVNVPPFPLLPREIKTVSSNPPPVAVVAPKLVAPVASVTTSVPALVIVGTHVSSDTNDVQKYSSPASNVVAAAPPVKTNLPAPTNRAVAATKPAVATNLSLPTNPSVLVTVTNPPTSTNRASATVERVAEPFDKVLVGSGVVLMAVAAGLVFFLLGRRRRPRGSLITSSMQDDLPPTGRK